jgi:methylmalonyl-CoA mutase N-terminal domain/subunit
MYLVVAEKHGASWQSLSGTIQNDSLKEFIAQKEYIYPPRPSMRLITDVFTFCAAHVPRWNTISVSGYHIREAGATAAQEMAFTLATAWAERAACRPGRRRFAPVFFLLQLPQRLLRGSRSIARRARVGAHVMRDRFKAKSERRGSGSVRRAR